MKTLPVVLALLVLACAAGAAEPDGLSIRLRPSARADGAFVRLAEAADLSGRRAAEAGEVLLGRAPEAGQRRTIARRFIEERLQEEGFAAAAFAFEGAGEVVVRSAAPEAPAAKPAKNEPAAVSERLKTLAAGWLRAELVRGLGLPPEAAEDAEAAIISIRPVGEVGDGAGLEPQVKWGAERPRLGRAQVEIVLRKGTAESGRLEVIAELAVTRTGLVAARDLAAGRRLESGDVRAGRVRLAEAGGDCLADPQQLPGLVTIKPLKEGTPLSPRLLAREVLVRRGQPVTVVFQAGAVSLSQTAVARSDGTMGEPVVVERLGSRTQLAGKVAGPGTVKVE